MTASATLAFLHHAAAFVLVAALMVELVLMRAPLTVTSAQSVLRMDAVYGVSAAAVLIVGFLRVFYTEKGADYYFGSLPFWIKIGAFAVAGLLSIHPTRQFLSWRRGLRQGQVPVLEDSARRRLRLVIHVELTLIFIAILCAALMARGIGFIG